MTPEDKLTYAFIVKEQMSSSNRELKSETYNYSLAEATTAYLICLTPDNRLKAQQEVNKFVRWYGDKRPIRDLTIPEVSDYTDYVNRSANDPGDKLEAVKAFLEYAYKQKLITSKLAPHVKVKKSTVKISSSSRRRKEELISLTAQGYTDLQAELEKLKGERPGLAEEIRKAAADKDFRENAPLEAAREQLGYLESRIRELESSLKKASVIDEKVNNDHKIKLGDMVAIRDMHSSELITYILVDAREANPVKGKISVVSPIGRAIVGKTKGELVKVNAPAGILPYKIEEISRPS